MNKDTMTELPRIDLREPAFRRYEEDIARALGGTIDINVISRGIKPSSYVLRFTDAKRAFKLYQYNSALIPAGTDLSHLKAVELSDHMTVRIKNTKTVPANHYEYFDQKLILDALTKLSTREIPGPVLITFNPRSQNPDNYADLACSRGLKVKAEVAGETIIYTTSDSIMPRPQSFGGDEEIPIITFENE